MAASAQVADGQAGDNRNVLVLANEAGAPENFITVPKGVWFNGDFTVESWVYLYSYGTWTRLFDFSNGPNNDNINFVLSNHKDMPAIAFRNGSTAEEIFIDTQIPLNKWTHVALVVEKGVVTVYFNGTSVLSQTLNVLPKDINRTQNYIGKSPWTNDALSNMLIDDFRIFNKARTIDEIRTYQGQHLAGNEDGLILYYDFDNDNNTVITDKSASKANGSTQNVSSFLPASYTKTANSETSFSLNWNTVNGQKYRVAYSIDKDLVGATTEGNNDGKFKATDKPEGIKCFKIGALDNSYPDKYNYLSVDNIGTAPTFPGNAYRCGWGDNISFTVNDGIRSLMFWAKIPNSNVANDSLFSLSNVTGSSVFSNVYIDGKQAKTASTWRSLMPKDRWFAVYAEFNASFSGTITFGFKDVFLQIDQLAFIKSTLSAAQIENYTHATDMYPAALATYNFDLPSDVVDKASGMVQVTATKSMYNFVQSKAVITPFMRELTPSSATELAASWDAIPSATTYELQYANNSLFTGASVQKTANPSLVFDVQNTKGDTIFARVRSISATDTSEWSGKKNIKIMPFPGHAITFKDKGDYVALPANTVGNAFTVEAWVNLADYDLGWSRFFEFGNGQFADNLVFAMTDWTRTTQAVHIRKGTDQVWQMQIPTPLPLKTWTHVAVSFDSLAANDALVRVYYNGVLVLSEHSTVVPNQITRTNNFLGYSAWQETPHASFDEFRVYDYAVSQDSIIARMHQRLTGNEKGLLLYYTFDNRTNWPSVIDESGNGQDGVAQQNAVLELSKGVIVPTIRTIDSTTEGQITFHWDKIANTKEYQVELNGQNIKVTQDTSASFDYSTAWLNRYRVRSVSNDGVISDWSSKVYINNKVPKENYAYAGKQQISTKAVQNIQLAYDHSLTVAAWVKGFNPRSWSYVFEQHNVNDPKSNLGRAFYMANGHLRVGYGIGANWQDFTCKETLDSSKWNHVAFTQSITEDQKGGKITMYINGVECKNFDNSKDENNSNVLMQDLASAVTETDDYRIKPYPEPILLDNFQIYGRALTAEELITLSHKTVTADTDLLLGYDFDQADGSELVDIAGNSNGNTANDISSWKPSTAQYTTFIRSFDNISDTTIGVHWDSIPGATGYELRYDTDSLLRNAVIMPSSKITTAAHSTIIAGLQSATKYFIQVKTIIAGDVASNWSVSAKKTTSSLNDSLITYHTFDKYVKDGSEPVFKAYYGSRYVADRFNKNNHAAHLGTTDSCGFLQYVDDNNSKNNLSAQFTIALWFNADSLHLGTLLSKNESLKGYSISIGKEGKIHVAIDGEITSSEKMYKANQWNFLVVKRDAQGNLHIMLNDSLAATPSQSPAPTATTVPFSFGAYTTLSYFVGSLDDVRIYNRCLSDKEASRLYHENGWPYLGINLSKDSVTEQLDAGKIVGLFTTTVANDLVANPNYSYELVGGTGSVDNAKFKIVGNQLVTNAILDAQQQATASIRVRCTNNKDGQSIEAVKTITIKDSSNTEVYDFEELTVNQSLNGQDGWQKNGK